MRSRKWLQFVLTVCICTRLEKETFALFKRNEFGTFKKEKLKDNIELLKDEICQIATSTLKNSWTIT